MLLSRIILLMDEKKPGSVISPSDQNDNSTQQEVVFQVERGSVPQSIQPLGETSPTLAQIEEDLGVSRGATAQDQAAVLPTLAVATPQLTQPHQAINNAYSDISQDHGPATNAHVSWTASEFIDHAKSINWYLTLGIIGLLGAVGVYFWTKDIISAIAIAIVALLFGIGAGRKPRVLPYEINESGVEIDGKLYHYSDFKTFSLIHDGGPFSSIQLMPLKRFAPPVSMYFSPEDEDKIATALSNYLPYEERKMDATDRLLRRIRF